MSTLTPRQAQILELIEKNIADTGMPPTRAEIARILGFRSANAAEQHLKALAKKGVLELLPGTSRGIRLLYARESVPPSRRNHSNALPVVGRVAAGHPILALQHIETHYALPGDMFYPKADYLLRVEGMSMKEAGILDGDLLAVHATNEARNRQIVVARVDEEVTVKRFWRRGQEIRLLPENSEFKPISVDPSRQNLAIEGLGVGVIRNHFVNKGLR